MSKKQKPVDNAINPDAPFFNKQASQVVSAELLTAAFIAGQTAVFSKPMTGNKPGFLSPDEISNLEEHNNPLGRFMLGLMDFLNTQGVSEDIRPAVLMRSQLLLSQVSMWDIPEWAVKKEGDVMYISEYALAAAAVAKINTDLGFDKEDFIALAKSAQEQSA